MLLVIVSSEDDAVSDEHIDWDQASVLIQLGLLKPERRPVVASRSVASL